jgi:hypothetical protein
MLHTLITIWYSCEAYDLLHKDTNAANEQQEWERLQQIFPNTKLSEPIPNLGATSSSVWQNYVGICAHILMGLIALQLAFNMEDSIRGLLGISSAKEKVNSNGWFNIYVATACVLILFSTWQTDPLQVFILIVAVVWLYNTVSIFESQVEEHEL